MLAYADASPSRRRLPPTLVVGTTLLVLILLGSLAAPLLAPFRFDTMNVLAGMRAPDAVHWLGTDEFGRDVFSRVLHGGSTSIGLGVAATAFSFVIGVPLGLIGGYVGDGATTPSCAASISSSRSRRWSSASSSWRARRGL